LSKIACTNRLSRFAAGSCKNWKQNGRQDSNDCYNNKQFNQGKSALHGSTLPDLTLQD
jgi:hypothetical protein